MQFCPNCGLNHARPDIDNSFLEQALKRLLRFIRVRRLGFTHRVMWTGARLLCMEPDGWGAEEMAYILGFALSSFFLGLSALLPTGVLVSAWLLLAYAGYRIFDIVTYELEIVFMGQAEDSAHRGGHVLSIDRRVICIFLHLVDFIVCFALVYISVSALFSQGDDLTKSLVGAPVNALYFSVIVATFTGLSGLTPCSLAIKATVMVQIMCTLVLVTTLLSTVTQSLPQLRNMTPRPPRAPRIFGHREKKDSD